MLADVSCVFFPLLLILRLNMLATRQERGNSWNSYGRRFFTAKWDMVPGDGGCLWNTVDGEWIEMCVATEVLSIL